MVSRSMISTMSASRITSRVALPSAIEGRSRRVSSRCSIVGSPGAFASGIRRSSQPAATPVRGRKTSASARLKRVWKSAIWRAGSLSRRAMPSAARRRTRSAASAPASRNRKLPNSTRFAAAGARSDRPIGISPEPMLAPSTSAIPSGADSIAAEVSEITSSTIATLEWNSQVRSAPTMTARIGSSPRRWSTSVRTSLPRKPWLAATTIPSDRIISARPMTMRPTCCTVAFSNAMKAITPAMSSTGTRPERSKARACTTRVEPTSAPSITASAAESAISPRSANDTTMSPVADELCTALATPMPARQARSGLAVACATARRKRSPKARSTPVRTIRVAQSRSAMPPRRLRRTVWPATVAECLAGLPLRALIQGHCASPDRESQRKTPAIPRLFVGFLPLYHPLMRRVVAEAPDPAWAGHDIQVIEAVAVRRADRVVAPRHEHDVAVLDRHRLVERAVVGVDALDGVALGRVEAVVIGLLEERLVRQRVAVMLVRRIARPMARRRDDLDDEEAVRRLGLGDVLDVAGVRAGAARETLDRVRPDEPRRVGAAARARADRKLERGRRRGAPGRARRHVDRGRLALEGRHPAADLAKALAVDLDPRFAGDEDEAGLALAGRRRCRFPRREPVDLESDIGPAGALGRDLMDAAAAGGGLEEKLRHRAHASPAASR